MAQMVLGAAGGMIGGGIGRSIGAALGGMLDRAALGRLTPARAVGPRLEGLRIQSTAEGAPMTWMVGRTRVAGQMIWAARFRERLNESGGKGSEGGKGAGRTVRAAYSLSFAVAVCEGPIDGIGRVWADGQEMDLSGVTLRVHRGGPDQTPDPLIEAVEGEAPAYRGTAYAVFEDLPLGPYGDRPPQLSFEVFRAAPGGVLEERLEGVCLIPGAGEFVLATEPVFRRDGLTKATSENVHTQGGGTDLSVSLDRLEARFPNMRRVNLVVGWFGDDLRAGHCRVRPGVEGRDRTTAPMVWSVAGLDRAGAHLISTHDGGPAYGGTPSDDSVRQAVAALKARGWAVTLYPFVFMDIAADNALPDPYGGARQAAYPWRGRIRVEDGADVDAAIGALFGGEADWGLRRMTRHYAALAAECGADGLVLGSEMRGVTGSPDSSGGFPAVEAYRALAAECRAIVGPEVMLSYAADWSEYASARPADGSGDVIFHLDPLWADPNIDVVGIDWYPPMGDWREGDGGADAEVWGGPSDPDYLAAQIAGGEYFDWFYASAEDRAAQVRSPISDGAHGETWIYRAKDLAGWWSSPHHDRIGGARAATPSAWVPGMKPIRLFEFGCAAVDRGGNAPNVFIDPKSVENGLPPFSTGMRDDRMQRRALEAVLTRFDDPAVNPLSSVYGGPMMAGMDVWCWDARPWPAFPALETVWTDAPAWRRGHWLNGREGGAAERWIADLLARGEVGLEAVTVDEAVSQPVGYAVERPMRLKEALGPLTLALGLQGVERGAGLAFLRHDRAAFPVSESALAKEEDRPSIRRERTLEPGPDLARVRFVDEGRDYQIGAATVRADAGSARGGGALDVDLPVTTDAGLAEGLARRLLDRDGAERVVLTPGPLEGLRLEPGGRVRLDDDSEWRVERASWGERGTREAAVLELVAPETVGGHDAAPEWRGEAPSVIAPPFFRIVEPPPLPGATEDARPLAVVAGDPWRPCRVWAGPDVTALRPRAEIERPATVGVLTEAPAPGPIGRWDRTGSLTVAVEGRAPQSRTDSAVLGGANALMLETAKGWEMIQFRHAELIGPDRWRLSGLLRGAQGTEAAAEIWAAAGGLVVFLDEAITRADVLPEEIGGEMIWRAGPDGGAAGGAGLTDERLTLTGRHHRPWRPVGLRLRRGGGATAIRWFGRDRSGDDWDAPDTGVRRYRLRILDGASEVRRFEVEGDAAVYPDDWRTIDFEDGMPANARVGVAEAGGREGGWGDEAVASLPV